MTPTPFIPAAPPAPLSQVALPLEGGSLPTVGEVKLLPVTGQGNVRATARVSVRSAGEVHQILVRLVQEEGKRAWVQPFTGDSSRVWTDHPEVHRAVLEAVLKARSRSAASTRCTGQIEGDGAR
jgi:hypothetical protein